MDSSGIKFTDRMVRIMRNAENEASFSKSKVLNPLHLLIACLSEKTGVLGEISLRSTIDIAALRNLIHNDSSNQYMTSSVLFNAAVTAEVIKVFEAAMRYMKGYNQIFLNEGHLLKALIKTNVIEHLLSDEDKTLILNLGTSSRDMISHLGSYTFPILNSDLVRKVNHSDSEQLIRFEKKNFSYEWSQTISEGFSVCAPYIYIALNNEEIVGFAAFDVYQRKKCYFGPMGVSVSNRVKGIGYSLLHHCLKDMKDIGYEYAIFGGAGPIEFYEKACNAVVIPKV